MTRSPPPRCSTSARSAGTTKPSQANEEAFYAAVKEIAHITEHLLDDLVTAAPPKNREVEAAKARARAQVRYGT